MHRTPNRMRVAALATAAVVLAGTVLAGCIDPSLVGGTSARAARADAASAPASPSGAASPAPSLTPTSAAAARLRASVGATVPWQARASIWGIIGGPHDVIEGTYLGFQDDSIIDVVEDCNGRTTKTTSVLVDDVVYQRTGTGPWRRLDAGDPARPASLRSVLLGAVFTERLDEGLVAIDSEAEWIVGALRIGTPIGPSHAVVALTLFPDGALHRLTLDADSAGGPWNVEFTFVARPQVAPIVAP